jgi:hypothetical protein
MKYLSIGFVLALCLSLTGAGAERLKKTKIAEEDPAYFEKNRPAVLVDWVHPDYPPTPGAEWKQRVVSVAFEIDAEGRVRRRP